MANLFAVGLPFTYDGTTNHFATTTGGTATVAAVTSADTVNIDTNSGAATMTIGAAFSCTALTINKSGATVACDATHGITASGAVTLTLGTLNTNGQTCSWGSFVSSNTNVRTLTMGASNITITGGGVSWNVTATSLTISTNTATIKFTGAAASMTTGGVSYNGTSLQFNGSGAATMGTGTFAAITRTGTAVKGDSFLLNNTGVTVTGALTLTGNSITNRLLFGSTPTGSTRTVTAGSVVASNLDVTDITGAGAANWDLSAITGGSGDAGGNTNLTFTTPAAQTRSGAGGNWSAAGNWTSRVPLPQDDVIVNSGASGTITGDMPRLGRSIDFTGFAGTYSSSVAGTNYGSVTLEPLMTFTLNGLTWTFAARSAVTVTTATKTWNGSVTLNMPGGTWTLQDTFTSTFTLNANFGTVDTNNQTVNLAAFNSNNSNTRSITLGISTINLTGTGTIWTITTSGMTSFLATSSTIVVASTSASATMNLASLNYGAITYTGSTGTTTLALGGSPSMTAINLSGGRTVTFQASNTYTIGTWNASGTAGNLLTIKSGTAGTAATLSYPNGVKSGDYLSLQDLTATGGATWYAGANSTNVSGNTGWVFTAPSAGFLMFM